MIAFNSMPADAKVWIYASDKMLPKPNQEAIYVAARDFFSGWTAHQVPVDAAFQIMHDLFLVVMVDETRHGISGCGIDKSVAFMKEISARFNMELFNRLQIELLVNDQVIITGRQEAKALLLEGKISPETIAFNKNILLKRDFDTLFKIPVKDAWFYPGIKTSAFAE